VSKFQLAASAEMLFLDLPFAQRVLEIKNQGFLVEIWNWATKDLDELARTGATFQSMTGYLEGDLLEEDGISTLLRTAEESIHASNKIGCNNLNIHGTGLDSNGQAIRKIETTTKQQWEKAKETLAQLALLGERHGKVFTLENLNLLVDHPGTPFAKASETIELVSSINHPNLRLNLDLYHAQIGEGNLAETITRALPWIGEIQVADVPGRKEPGTGEINHAFIATHLANLGYTGVVGLEGWASGDSQVALEAFRKSYTPA
jgi:hydroxypyruvate isomerase